MCVEVMDTVKNEDGEKKEGRKMKRRGTAVTLEGGEEEASSSGGFRLNPDV